MVSQKPQLIGESKASANQESLPLVSIGYCHFSVEAPWCHFGLSSCRWQVVAVFWGLTIGSQVFLMIPLRTTSFQRIQRYSWCYVPSPTKKRMGVIRISLLSGRACCLNCSEDQLIQQVLRQAEDWELLQQFSKSIHFLTKESRHHFTFSRCSKSSWLYLPRKHYSWICRAWCIKRHCLAHQVS